MVTEQMEVARALNELTLLKKRMQKAMDSVKFFDVSIGGKPVAGFKSNDEFIERAKSAFDSYRALLNRYNAIKAAVNRSNATTIIKVAGKEMTVAEAIERQRNIIHEELFLEKLKSDYNTAVRLQEIKNREAETKLEAYLNSLKEANLEPAELEAATAVFMKQFRADLVHPEDLKKQIEALEEDINSFKAEVNYALNRSNATTMIEVAY